MQPYLNPNYFNYQMTQANPYQQYIPQQPCSIVGKYVNDFNEVNANDVSMDGKPSVFVKNNRDEIQIREWSPNGQIVTTSYKAILANNDIKANNSSGSIENKLNEANIDIFEPIFERLDALEKKIDKINKPKTRKEVSDDE